MLKQGAVPPANAHIQRNGKSSTPTARATILQAQRAKSRQMKNSPTGQQCDSEKT